MDAVAPGHVIAPELLGLEADRIKRLRVFALVVRGGIGKDMAAVIGGDDAGLAADIAREPRVARDLHIPRADLRADAESGR